jgi:hypothetical protein
MTYNFSRTNNNLSPENLYPGCSNNESTRTEVHPLPGLLSFPVTDFNAQGDFHRAGYIKRLEWLAPTAPRVVRRRRHR